MNEFNRIDTTANRIRIALKSAGMRQADLAREADIDKGALSHYLKGRYEPKQDVIYRMAQVLGVSEMWLWGYDCKKERDENKKEKPTVDDGFSEKRKALIDFAKSLSDDQAALALRLLKSLVEAD